jgi:glyoxylase I family protein
MDIHGIAPLLAVFDMPIAVNFYRDILGFEVVMTSQPGQENYGWALLRLHGADLMLNTAFDDDQRPDSLDPERRLAHRDMSLYFDCSDLDAAYRHLVAHGVDAEEPFDQPYGMRQLYLRDPDGYSLCFQHPTRRT